MNGVCCETPKDIANAFIQYYKMLLGSDTMDRVALDKDVVLAGPILSIENSSVSFEFTIYWGRNKEGHSLYSRG